MRFVDEIEIIAASGNGGDGCISFHRAKFLPRGGPDGGNGGDGGALVFRATRQRNTLVDYRRNKRYFAKNGRPGMGKQMYGPQGEDVELLVPVGTVIYDADSGEVLADLDEQDATWAIKGGKGGAGNMAFKSATNRTPRIAEPGTPGQERRLRLELKLIADVGLLGFPNAGKSTFIAAVTASKSPIGAHPFTTITPQLGVVKLSEARSFVLADMPGLIEGAAEGHGLGHQFLRHVERCALYLHLLAPDEWEGDVAERWAKLNTELREYEEMLVQRPQLVVITKSDLLSPEERVSLTERLRAVIGGRVFVVSAVTGDGIPELIEAVWKGLAELRGIEAEE